MKTPVLCHMPHGFQGAHGASKDASTYFIHQPCIFHTRSNENPVSFDAELESFGQFGCLGGVSPEVLECCDDFLCVPQVPKIANVFFGNNPWMTESK